MASCKEKYLELKEKDMYPLTKSLGFKEPYDGQSAIFRVKHLINWTDVENVVKWLFDNGYDIVKLRDKNGS